MFSLNNSFFFILILLLILSRISRAIPCNATHYDFTIDTSEDYENQPNCGGGGWQFNIQNPTECIYEDIYPVFNRTKVWIVNASLPQDKSVTLTGIFLDYKTSFELNITFTYLSTINATVFALSGEKYELPITESEWKIQTYNFEEFKGTEPVTVS